MSQERQPDAPTGKALPGLAHHPSYFKPDAQNALIRAVAAIVAHAPLFQPVMPKTGKPFSVRMTNCGRLGWVSDQQSYRYQATHPATGHPWPPIPDILLALWHDLSGFGGDPEACLINVYGATGRLGSHQDRDEEELAAPVISVSLGDTASFHIGGVARTDPKAPLRLGSGDVLVMGGASRLAHHGVDRILPDTSSIDLSAIHVGCRRVSLTLRRVTRLR